jgi:hypothetical protein
LDQSSLGLTDPPVGRGHSDTHRYPTRHMSDRPVRPTNLSQPGPIVSTSRRGSDGPPVLRSIMSTWLAGVLLIASLTNCQRTPQQRQSSSSPIDTSAMARPHLCRAADLIVTPAGGDAGAGQRGVIFALHNKSRSACFTKGYPSLRLLDMQGHPLDSLKMMPFAGSDFDGSAAPDSILLDPGNVASFQIEFTGIRGAGIPCYQATRLEIVPPGAADTLSIATTIAPCGNHINVAPIRHGLPPSGEGSR